MPHNPRCESELARLLVWIPDHGAPEIRRPLSDEERAVLVAHRVALEHTLKPFGDGAEMTARASISATFSGFRSMRQQGDDVVAITAITLSVLREFPAWAITRGCLDIVQGRTELDRRFAPNDAEIYHVVNRIVDAERRRLRTADLLLAAGTAPAKTPSPLRRDRPPAPLAPPWSPERREALLADLAARKERNDAVANEFVVSALPDNAPAPAVPRAVNE